MALLGSWRATTFSSSFCTQLAGHQEVATERVGRPVPNFIAACQSVGKIGQKLRTRVQKNNAARSVQGQKSVPPQNALGRSPPSLHRAASGAEAQAYTIGNAKTSEGFQSGDSNSSKQGNGEAGDVRAVHIKLTPLTQENFAPFGQVCGAMSDGVEFGGEDAQLELDGGVPRLYILRLKGKALKFDRITHHARVTQCLGSADGRPWYMGVAPPSLLSDVPGEDGRLPWAPPAVEDVRVFKIEGPTFLKLNKGTWHAGPLFEDPQMDFYNLEHTDTNVIDHNTHVFSRHDKAQFVIDDS